MTRLPRGAVDVGYVVRFIKIIMCFHFDSVQNGPLKVRHVTALGRPLGALMFSLARCDPRELPSRQCQKNIYQVQVGLSCTSPGGIVRTGDS